MAKLFLHLGDPAGGATAIRSALAALRPPCGWLYPETGRRLDEDGADHDGLLRAADRIGRPEPGEIAQSALAQEIRAASATHVVLALRDWTTLDPERVAAALDRACGDDIAEVKAIAHIRPHAPRLLTLFARRIACGCGPFDRSGFLDRMLGGEAALAPRLSAWVGAFDARGWRVSPRLDEPHRLAHGDLLGDFAEAAGLRALPPGRVDPAAPPPSAAALRMIQIYAEALRRAHGPGAARRAALDIAPCAMRMFGPHLAAAGWRAGEAERIRDAMRADAMALDALLAERFGLIADFTMALDSAVAAAAPDASQDLPPEAEMAAMITAAAAAAKTYAAAQQADAGPALAPAA